MRPGWRLGINSLFARRSRSVLLCAAIALSTALVVAIGGAMASTRAAIERQVNATVGKADLVVRGGGRGGGVPRKVLEAVRAWPEVELAVGRMVGDLSMTVERPIWERNEDGELVRVNRRYAAVALASGIDPEHEFELRPLELVEGRYPRAPGEVVIDELLAERLSFSPEGEDEQRPGAIRFQEDERLAGEAGNEGAGEITSREAARANRRQVVEVGDEITAYRWLSMRLFRREVLLRVVGVAAQPPLGGRPRAYLTQAGLAAMPGQGEGFDSIDVVLKRGVEVTEAFIESRQADLDETAPELIVQSSAKITSALDRNVKSSELGYVLAVLLATMSASFIVLTGMTTAVAQRKRELAILRCVGASRGQLAGAQLVSGAILGLVGAVLGVPLGLAVAALVTWVFREQLPGGLVFAPGSMVSGLTSGILSGLVGASWPAFLAARVPPLRALAAHAKSPSVRGLLIVTLVGLAGVAWQLIIVGVPDDGQIVFWGYATTGLPAMLTGYFLLGVAATLAIVGLVSGPLSRLLGLPRHVLARTVRATPYRHGLTAGALMGGLALMVTIWTQGGSLLRDWLGRIDFPDAFVSGLALTEESREKLEGLEFVEGTTAITMHFVETDAFGIQGLQKYQTAFIAFEPEPFFEMTRLEWVEGDRETAQAKLEEGGSIIVAREFQVAKGLGVGDTLTVTDEGESFDFEIVGVVTSPGLEVVSKFFNIGEQFHQQSLHAIFGSREDLRELFGSEAISLIQIDLADDVDDEAAMETIRRELFGAGILDAGSGRQIKANIREFALGMLVVFSTIAVSAMLVASFGVANVIIAGIEARQYEFGVLRAVGASRGMLARLVLGEAAVIALAAAALGTTMGLQGAWAERRMAELLLGLVLEARPPWGLIAGAWVLVLGLALAAAGPAAWRLARRPARELLAGARE